MSDGFLARVAALGQFRVGDPSAPVLARDDDHHLRSVLRATPGENVVVTDGVGAWAIARVEPVGLALVTPVAREPEPEPRALYLAPLKGDRSEWAVIKATELGVSTIVPLLSARVAVRFRAEARAKILARWRRLAAEASAQSRRVHYPTIGEPVTPQEVPGGVAVADFAGGAHWASVGAVAIGPEGGWEDGEWDQDHPRLSLGPTVLRAETAAVAAATLLAFHAPDWPWPHRPRDLGNDESSYD
ncbi:MAG: 16S rRNA (uracil(1498)-N(3))-methyltransferase [Actinomycetales bacterium]|nr:16S rRNA (uracil(1498)-N(3))-methyltransferase [Actinomycetales bacterium]